MKFALCGSPNHKEVLAVTEVPVNSGKVIRLVFDAAGGPLEVLLTPVHSLRQGKAPQSGSTGSQPGAASSSQTSTEPMKTEQETEPALKPQEGDTGTRSVVLKVKGTGYQSKTIIEESTENKVETEKQETQDSRVPESLSPTEHDHGETEKQETQESRVPESLSPDLMALQTKRAAMVQVAAVASPQPRIDAAGEDEVDITSMSSSQVEKALQGGGVLPGWNQKGDPTKDLAYVKIFFQAKLMGYDPATLWPPTGIETSLKPLLEELKKQFESLHREGTLNTLPAQSQYDLRVIEVWYQHMMNGVVPHGPMLGWAKMQGHELYYHVYGENISPFLMARLPGKTYNEHPVSLKC